MTLGYIQPITLPPTRTSTTNPVSGFVEIAGWGSLEEGGPLPNTLHMTVLPVINIAMCSFLYGVRNKPGMFCASEAGRDACQGRERITIGPDNLAILGDSGGPAVNQHGVLVGIVSHGVGCGRREYPGVFTDVSTFANWIVNKMLEESLREKNNKFLTWRYAVRRRIKKLG